SWARRCVLVTGAIGHEIAELVHHQKHVPDDLRTLDKKMADKYFCNFSLFQSMPDSWGIDQLFPIMPIERLAERPTRSATLQDITCDSDGKVTAYVNGMQQTSYLPMHPIEPGEHYYIGVFLVGAYQEIMGNMHNLFGDTNAVHISIDDNGGYEIEQIIDGESVADVLEYVQYEPKKLVRRLEIWVSKAVKEGKITESEGKEFISNYRSGLYGYTYLE
ncbi:MAG: arginine decarboxylase, partial [Bacteroidaceae bacterium]|nr:arginine decarboxylase [Bacteroidaceae bacterium]